MARARGRLGIELAEHRGGNDDARILRLLPGQSEFAQDGGRVVLLRPVGRGEAGAVLQGGIRAALQQHVNGPRIGVVRGHCHHQGRHLANVPGIHFGAGIEQRFRHVGSARGSREHERGEIAQRDGAVLHNLGFLGADRIHFGAFRQEQFDRLQVAVARRVHQRRQAAVVRPVERRTFLNQDAYGGEIVGRRGRHERLRLQFRPMLEEKAHRGRGAIVGRCQIQRGPPHLGFGVDIGPGGH